MSDWVGGLAIQESKLKFQKYGRAEIHETPVGRNLRRKLKAEAERAGVSARA